MTAENVLVAGPPADAAMLRTWIESGGRRVQCAAGLPEALDTAARVPFGVILGESPDARSGLQFARRIRRISPQTRIILSGEPGLHCVLAALRAGAFAYMHKPLSRGPVVDMVQLALETPSWRDDIRVLSAVPDWISMDVRCTLSAAERAVHFAREIEAALPRGVCEDVTAAFREILLNAVEHGGKSNPRKRARASLVRAGDVVIGIVEDPGKGFSLRALPHAAIANPADCPTRHAELRDEQGRRPGGFGILMARSLVDALAYNARGNRALFVKRLPQPLV